LAEAKKRQRKSLFKPVSASLLLMRPARRHLFNLQPMINSRLQTVGYGVHR
jgi:hypothetical protein